MKTSTSLSLTRRTSLRRLGGQLQRQLGLHAAGSQHSRWQLYDSVDGRLRRAGQVLVWAVEAQDGQLGLRDLRDGALLAMLPLAGQPSPLHAAELPHPLPHGPLATQVQALLGEHALASLGAVQVYRLQLAARDDDGKTIARLGAEEYRLAGLPPGSAPMVVKRLVIDPLRGYQKSARQLERRLKADFALAPAEASVLEQLLGGLDQLPSHPLQRRKPAIAAAMPAAVAARRILRWLLATMEANEPGVLAGIDSEFLHDYRVAVRTTQAVVKQLRPVLGAGLRASMLTDFAWLGGLTGTARDLDVALIALADYRAALRTEEDDHLEALRAQLDARREQERAALGVALTSVRYRRLKAQWRRLLAPRSGRAAPQPGMALSAAATEPTGTLENSVDEFAATAIAAVVRQRSARLYQRVRRAGRALTADADSAIFHELRKSCKKLNYMMTLFRELYAADDIEPLLRKLKRLQRNLGDQQDIEVQTTLIAQALHARAQLNPLAASELRAVAALVTWYAQRKTALRAGFAGCLQALIRPKTRARMRALWQPGP